MLGRRHARRRRVGGLPCVGFRVHAARLRRGQPRREQRIVRLRRRARSRGRGGTRGDDGVGRARHPAEPRRGRAAPRPPPSAPPTRPGPSPSAAGSWGPRRPRPRGAASRRRRARPRPRAVWTAVAARSNRSFATPTRSAWNPARRQRARRARVARPQRRERQLGRGDDVQAPYVRSTSSAAARRGAAAAWAGAGARAPSW